MKHLLTLLGLALLALLMTLGIAAQDCFPCPPDVIYAAKWPPDATCYWKQVEIDGVTQMALARCYGTPAISPLPALSPLARPDPQIYLPWVACNGCR